MKRRKRETKRQRKAREATYVRVVQHGQSNVSAVSPAELGFAHWWHGSLVDSIGGVDLVADADDEPALK